MRSLPQIFYQINQHFFSENTRFGNVFSCRSLLTLVSAHQKHIFRIYFSKKLAAFPLISFNIFQSAHSVSSVSVYILLILILKLAWFAEINCQIELLDLNKCSLEKMRSILYFTRKCDLKIVRLQQFLEELCKQ